MLDKDYFNECFEQSVTIDYSWRAYAKAIFFALFGTSLLLITEVNPYAAWFVVGLGVVEALSVRYQKPWWVMRQMLGKTANSEVTLTLDEQQIRSQSFYNDSHIPWQNVNSLTQTAQGWLIVHNQGKHYISARFLSPQANDFLADKAVNLTTA